MDTKRLTTLALATLVVAVGAGLALKRRAAAVEPQRNDGYLLDTLHERVNEAAAVTLAKDGWTIAAALVPGEDAGADAVWVLSEKGGYPVDFEKLRKVVVAASNLERRDPMTSRAQHYSKLGVDDSAPRLTVRDAAGAVLADVYLGDPKGADGLYARVAGDPQSWLVRGRVDLPYRELEWVDSKVLELDTERVVSAELTHPDGEVVSVEQVAGATPPWRVLGVPEGREQAPAGAASGVGAALAWVSFEDVAPLDSIDFADAVRARYRLADGLAVVADVVERDGASWLRLSAEVEPVLGPVPSPADDSDTDAPDLDPAPNPSTEVAELNLQHGRWAYRIPEFKAQSLTRHLEDLLVPLPEPGLETAPDPDAEPSAPASEETSEGEAPFVYEVFGDDGR